MKRLLDIKSIQQDEVAMNWVDASPCEFIIIHEGLAAN
jgi:hypothetical protein